MLYVRFAKRCPDRRVPDLSLVFLFRRYEYMCSHGSESEGDEISESVESSGVDPVSFFVRA